MAQELLSNSPTPGVEAPVGVLTAAINSSLATLPTAAGVIAPGLQAVGQFRVRIDSELMLVTASQNTTGWKVERGIEGTVAAAHAVNSAIYHDLTAGGLLSYLSGVSIGFSQLPPSVVGRRRKDLGTINGNVNFDLSTADVFQVTNGGTLDAHSVSNFPSGSLRLSFEAVYVGNKPITHSFLSGWRGGAEPKPDFTAGASSVNEYVYFSDDGGEHWYGVGEAVIPPSGLDEEDVQALIATAIGSIPTGLSKSAVDAEIAAQGVGNLSPIRIAVAATAQPTGDSVLYARTPESRALGTALSTAGTTAAIKLESGYAVPLWKGQKLKLVSGAHSQEYTLTEDVAIGATPVPVEAVKANFAYPATSTTVTPTTASVLAYQGLTEAIIERSIQRLSDPISVTASQVVKPGKSYLATKPGITLTLESFTEASGGASLYPAGELLQITNTSTGAITVTGQIEQNEELGLPAVSITLQPGQSETFVTRSGPREYRRLSGRPLEAYVPLTLGSRAQQTAEASPHGARLEASGTVTRIRGSLTVISSELKAGVTFATIPTGKRPPVPVPIIARLAVSPFLVAFDVSTTGSIALPTGSTGLVVGTVVNFDPVPPFPIS